MLIEAGVPDVTVAYPLLPLEAERVAAIIRNNQQVKVTVHVGSREHADVLAAAARRNGARVRYLVDLDVGCHRTGTSPTGAPELIRHLVETHAGALEFEGLHAYDGHNSHPSTSERDACAATAMEKVATCHAQLKGMGIAVRRVVAAGTPGFVPDLRELLSHRLEAEILVSPGTWIYWDTNYDEKMPGAFCLAAILYARVIDLPGSDLVTLNLGHKRWSIDQGPVHHFSVPGLEFVSATEEHTVLRCSGKRSLKYDDPVLIAPRHVCPTVNLWEHFILVGPDGQVENESLPVTARNR
jgi:D-serine deaminase-like pyridoxal phosphate-dependent protein